MHLSIPIEDLTLNIMIDEDVCNLSIPIPDHYPDTTLRKMLRGRPMFEARIEYDQKGDCAQNSEDIKQKLQELGIETGQPTLHLDSFNIISRSENIPETEEEQRMLRGLGKKALAVAIPLLKKHYNLNDEHLVTLLACVGDPISAREAQRISSLMNYDKEDLISQVMEWNQIDTDQQRLYLQRLSVKKLAKIIVKQQNMDRLSKYYETFGLFVVDRCHEGIYMVSPLSCFLR